MAERNGKTRPFTAVNYSAAKLAREKQRREYEQQKKEKLIFALFVVIILVMILFAILIFRKVLGNDEPVLMDNDTEIGTQAPEETQGDTEKTVSGAYNEVMIEKSDLYAGHLLLIDDSHPYRANAALDLTDIYSSRQKHDNPASSKGYVYSVYPADMTVLMEREALTALNALTDAFYTATGNYDLFVRPNAAYVENALDEHATGRAVNLSGWLGGDVYYSLEDPTYSANFTWIQENCYKYGFIRRYPEHKAAITGVANEPYHFLYVGTAHAYYMYEHDLCLEEYLELLRTKHTFKNGGEDNLVFTTDNGERYEVYFVSADGDMINLPVPTSFEACSYSGDNANGFVVTVKYGALYE